MQETWVQSLGWKIPLEKGMATHSSILAWRIPMDRGAWRARVHSPRMKELGLVILTCSFLSSVELAGKNVKVIIVLERSMRKHKAFCSCAQKIIYKITIDICSRIFTKNGPG